MTAASCDLDRVRAELVAAAGRFEIVATPDGFLVRNQVPDLATRAVLTRAVEDGLLAYADDCLDVECFVFPTLAAASLIVNGALS